MGRKNWSYEGGKGGRRIADVAKKEEGERG